VLEERGNVTEGQALANVKTSFGCLLRDVLGAAHERMMEEADVPD
jgi:hypothetical protein